MKSKKFPKEMRYITFAECKYGMCHYMMVSTERMMQSEK